MAERHRRRPALSTAIGACGLACALAAPDAWARPEATFTFSIPAKSAPEALIDFAIQSDTSTGGETVCHGTSGPLVGRFTVREGLTRLLAHTDCAFVPVEAHLVRIVRARSAAPAIPAKAPALAAQAPPVSEVIVTATRRRAASDRLAASISSINASQLLQSDAVNAGDLITQLAGMTTTNLGPGRDKIILRGLSDGPFTGRTQSTVGIFLDDTPITYNAPDPDLRLTDVNRVEVMRGPQGALYGAGNLSGVYRIVTNKPELDRAGGSLRVAGSVTPSAAPGDEIDLVANTPFAANQAALRLVAYREVDGGYIADVTHGSTNLNNTLRYGGRAAVRALLGEWTSTLTLTYQRIASNDTQYVDPTLGRLHRANQILENADNGFSQVALAAERTTPWGQLNISVAALHHQYASQADASTALLLFGAGQAGVGAYDETISNRMLVSDAVLTSPNSGRLQWLAGATASTSIVETRSVVKTAATASAAAQDLYQENREDRLTEAAAYGDVSYLIAPRLTAAAGARLSISRIDTHSNVVEPATGGQRLFAGARNYGAFAPTLSLKYQATDRTLVYVLSSGGRRLGGFNTSGQIGTVFATSPTAAGPRTSFAPDTLWNQEAGIKTTLMGGRLALQSAVFYEIWSNIQSDQYMASGLSYTANAGDGRNVGVELEAEAKPLKGLSIQANALLDKAVLERANPGFRAGASLPGVPSFSAGARVVYEWALPHGLTGEISSDAAYVGRSHLTFTAISPVMGDYVLSKIAVGVRAKAWSLTATLSNPANASGNTFSYGNPFELGLTRQVTPQRPRTIRVSVAANF